MAWCNDYTPPPAQEKLENIFGPEPYDVNFCLPLDLARLENDRVKLVPFIPKYHAAPFMKHALAHPQIFRLISMATPKSVDDLCAFLETNIRSNPGAIWFAVFDKTRTRPSDAEDECAGAPAEAGGGGVLGALAGCISAACTIPAHLSTEMSYVIVFPEFQRTHVLSNAAGLLLHYMLNLPSDATSPGWGLRRVQWVAHADNAASIAAAERLGFVQEGTKRWHWSVLEEKEGKPLREGDPMPNRLGRDNVYLSLCCDDWEAGKRERVKALMERRS